MYRSPAICRDTHRIKQRALASLFSPSNLLQVAIGFAYRLLPQQQAAHWTNLAVLHVRLFPAYISQFAPSCSQPPEHD